MGCRGLAMRRKTRLLVAGLGVGVLGLVGGWATFSAFSVTTSNTGNRIQMGDVILGSNDLGTFMYNETNVVPDEAIDRCITVTYAGSLAADVRLYGSPVQALGEYVDLDIALGTGSTTFPSCTGFIPDPGAPLFSGTLQSFSETHAGWATGIPHVPAGASAWATGDAVTYRFRLTVRSDNEAQGKDTGAHGFTWEAQNQ
jgi:hypothetical protein